MSVLPVYKRRNTITALPLYYSGQLLKKQKKEKDFKKYHAELRGSAIFLYQDDTQETYTEKLELEEIKSLKLDSPYKKVPTILSLKLRTQEVQLKMDNPDTGEEWRCYILTVVKREVPSKMHLLPGQVLQLQEVLAQERRRNTLMPSPPLPPRPSFLLSASAPHPAPDPLPEVPACFFNVTRQEAERMLEANPEYGGMILRPSTLANNYALTLRQVTSSGPVMRNYRVSPRSSGFVIELETAVAVSSLNDALRYFLEKTEHRFQPYTPSNPYDTRIDVLSTPNYVHMASPKTVPWAQVAPIPQPRTKEALPIPPPADNEYAQPDEHSRDDHKLKLAQLDGGLWKKSKLQRDATYTATDEEEVPIYKNQVESSF